MTGVSAERRRFDALVALYPNGTLSDEDRDFVERVAANDPDAQAVLDWHVDLAGEVNEDVDRRTGDVPELVGWTGLEKRLKAERAAQLPPARLATPRAHGPRLAESFSRSLDALFAMFGRRPVQAFAAALIAVQAVVIGVMLHDRPEIEYSATRGTAETRTVLQVRFKADAAESAMRELLYRSGARIVDGPDQLGDYVLEPRRGTLDELAGTLAASPLVQSVNTVADWAPEEP